MGHPRGISVRSEAGPCEAGNPPVAPQEWGTRWLSCRIGVNIRLRFLRDRGFWAKNVDLGSCGTLTWVCLEISFFRYDMTLSLLYGTSAWTGGFVLPAAKFGESAVDLAVEHGLVADEFDEGVLDRE